MGRSRPSNLHRLLTTVVVAASIGALAGPANAAVLPGIHGRSVTFPPAPALRELVERAAPRSLLVAVDRDLPIRSRPGSGRLVGTMPAVSRFYATPTMAWVRRLSEDGRFGLVDVPYVAEPASGWIPLRGLERSRTGVRVVADLSGHRITVRRGRTVLFRAPTATGAPASPTPTGRFVVSDRVAFSAGGSLGTYAFGMSGVQPDLPAGWTGGDQLAIHGTNAPSTIGRSASAGCLRVSEAVVERLKPLLRLGTPVVVRP